MINQKLTPVKRVPGLHQELDRPFIDVTNYSSKRVYGRQGSESRIECGHCQSMMKVLNETREQVALLTNLIHPLIDKADNSQKMLSSIGKRQSLLFRQNQMILQCMQPQQIQPLMTPAFGQPQLFPAHELQESITIDSNAKSTDRDTIIKELLVKYSRSSSQCEPVEFTFKPISKISPTSPDMNT